LGKILENVHLEDRGRDVRITLRWDVNETGSESWPVAGLGISVP